MTTEAPIELSNLTKEEKLDFLTEGSYGCAFKKEEPKNKKTKIIVKIQKLNSGATREDAIGKAIRKIPKYALYFAPILKTNIITLGEVDDEEIKKCTIITEEEDNKQKYVTNRIKYVGKYTLGDFVYKVFQEQPKHFLRTFYACYFDMLFNVHLLNKNGIVHFDMKENNVIYSEENERPVLIDFGLSIDTKKLTPEKYEEYFFTYGYDYPPWCFDASIITYGVGEFGSSLAKEFLTIEQVEKLCNNFTNINPIFFNDGETGHHDIFTAEERIGYNKNLKTYLQPFVGGPWKTVVDTHLKFMNTWDIYAVHVMFLLLLYHVHVYEYNTNEFRFVQIFISKLKREIVALPNERKTYEEITGELMNDFGQADRKRVEYVVKSIKKIATDEEKMADIKLKLDKLQLRELKKEKQLYVN
jgi:serine/threonine protein kinase